MDGQTHGGEVCELPFYDRAGDIDVPLSQTAAAREAFNAAKARGYGWEDMAAVIKPLEETVGVEVRDD